MLGIRLQPTEFQKHLWVLKLETNNHSANVQKKVIHVQNRPHTVQGNETWPWTQTFDKIMKLPEENKKKNSLWFMEDMSLSFITDKTKTARELQRKMKLDEVKFIPNKN